MADDRVIYYWGKRDCRALYGHYSAWAMGFSNEGDPPSRYRATRIAPLATRGEGLSGARGKKR